MKNKLLFASALSVFIAVLTGCDSDDDPTGIYEANYANCTDEYLHSVGFFMLKLGLPEPKKVSKSEERKARDLRQRCSDFYLNNFVVNYDNCEMDNPHYRQIMFSNGSQYEVRKKIDKACKEFSDPADTRYLPVDSVEGVDGQCSHDYVSKLPKGPGKDQLEKACSDIFMAKQQELYENMAKGIICPFGVCPPAQENTQ